VVNALPIVSVAMEKQPVGRRSFEAVAEALRIHGGRIGPSAATLGMKYHTLASRLARTPALRAVQLEARLVEAKRQAASIEQGGGRRKSGERFKPPRNTKKREEWREAVTRMLGEGARQFEIGRQLGVTREYVRQLLHAFGLYDEYLALREVRRINRAVRRYAAESERHRLLLEGADALRARGHRVECKMYNNQYLRWEVDRRWRLRCVLPTRPHRTTNESDILYYHANLVLPDVVYYVAAGNGVRAVYFPDDLARGRSIYLRADGEPKANYRNVHNPRYQWRVGEGA